MRRALLLLGSVVVLGASERPAHAQDDASPSRFASWFVGDAVGLARGVDRQTLALGAGLTGSVVLLATADGEVSEEAREHYAIGPAGDLLSFANELGEPRTHLAVGVVFLGTLLTNDTRLQDAAFTSFQAATYAGAVTVALKEAVGRSRPYTGAPPNTFRPFSGAHAFPSGHTTLAFALVTPWVVYYPGPATYALLVVAGGTAAARVAFGHHWPSDVLAGAAVGAGIGYALSRRHLGAEVPVTLLTSPDGGALVHFTMPF